MSSLNEVLEGTSPVARKKPDRTISSGAGGPAQLYLFVDVASFTEDWADLKLGDDELRALEDEFVSKGKLSSRGARIVKALNQFAADLATGTPMETKYTVRQVRVIPKPSLYPPARVRAVRELIGASQEVFAQLLAVSPMTIRSWEQGSRHPSPVARRFLDEIEMAPGHFRGRILTAAVDAGRSNRTRPSGEHGKNH